MAVEAKVFSSRGLLFENTDVPPGEVVYIDSPKKIVRVVDPGGENLLVVENGSNSFVYSHSPDQVRKMEVNSKGRPLITIFDRDAINDHYGIGPIMHHKGNGQYIQLRWIGHTKPNSRDIH